jgi:hypothetical protein
MTPFEQAILERIKVLDEQRATLVAALEYERGTSRNSIGTGGANAKSDIGIAVPPRPIEMLGISEQEQRTQLMLVLAAIQKLHGQFNKDAVLKQIEMSESGKLVTENTKKNIASFLWRLRKDNCIIQLEKGEGQKQSWYAIAP